MNLTYWRKYKLDDYTDMSEGWMRKRILIRTERSPGKKEDKRATKGEVFG